MKVIFRNSCTRLLKNPTGIDIFNVGCLQSHYVLYFFSSFSWAVWLRMLQRNLNIRNTAIYSETRERLVAEVCSETIVKEVPWKINMFIDIFTLNTFDHRETCPHGFIWKTFRKYLKDFWRLFWNFNSILKFIYTLTRISTKKSMKYP